MLSTVISALILNQNHAPFALSILACSEAHLQVCTKPQNPERFKLCGNDYKTYNNECFFEVAKCRNKDLKIAHRGKCEGK